MRSRREAVAKLKKLRKRFRKAIFDYGQQKETDNCKYWVSSIPGTDKCVYLAGGSLRPCPSSCTCPDFETKYTEQDLQEKYESLVMDNEYLARKYRDLFVMNWLLSDEPDLDVADELDDTEGGTGELSLPMLTEEPSPVLVSTNMWLSLSTEKISIQERFMLWIMQIFKKSQ